MPFTDISADQITAGAFTDSYTIDGQFIVGDTAGSHVVVGTDSHGADGVRIYAGDGVTPLIDLNISGASMVAGSVVAGAVSLATTATNATNLAGGGTASGSTTIAGALVVGNPATAHVLIGTDSHGADGVRLYSSDGVTPLIDLNIAGPPTITSAIIQTATSGPRMRIGGSAGTEARAEFFTTNADNEVALLDWGVTDNTGVPGGPAANASFLGFGSARTLPSSGSAAVSVIAASPDGLVSEHIELICGGPVIVGQKAFGRAAPGSQLIVRVGYPATGVMSYDGATLSVAGVITSTGSASFNGHPAGTVIFGSDQVRFDGSNYFTNAPTDVGGDNGFPEVTVIDGFGNEVHLIVEKWTSSTIYLATGGRLARDFGGATYATGTATRIRVVKPA